MGMFDFECKKCNKKYEALAQYDESGKYPDVKCPECGSSRKKKMVSCCQFAFSNPVGTDRWNSETAGHDYRFKHNIPNVAKEREMASALSHMGSDPYGDTSMADIGLGEGIHDPETRVGLS